jgi:hypothetical protein
MCGTGYEFCSLRNIAQPLDQIERTRLIRPWHDPGEEMTSQPRPCKWPGARGTHAGEWATIPFRFWFRTVFFCERFFLLRF